MGPKQARSQTDHTPPRRRRMRYTAHACTECQRRKTKCNGEKPCMNCVASAVTCQYGQTQQRGRPRRTSVTRKKNISSIRGYSTREDSEIGVTLRLRQLEEEIHTLRENQRRLSSKTVTPHSASGHGSASSLGLTGLCHPHKTPEFTNESNLNQTEINIPLNCDVETPRSIRPGQRTGHAQMPREGGHWRGKIDTRVTDQNQIFCLLQLNRDLSSNLQLFFDEFGYWLPFIEMKDIWPRLVRIFETGIAHTEGICVQLNAETNIPLLALVCTIMAVAEFLKAKESAAEPPNDHNIGNISHSHGIWYAESTELMRRDPCNQPSMDSLRQYLLSALYQLMLDRVHEASQAIARAVDMAYATDLNNERCWTGSSEDDRFSRRMLWWTLYLFDRRVARKIGRPYYIQDRDISVGDFSSAVGPHLEQSIGETLNGLGNPAILTSERCWIAYLQFHVEWSRISTKVWDTLYAMRAPNTGDEGHVEFLDAMVVRLQRNLPADLVWDTNAVSAISWDSGDAIAWSPKSRLQLVVFTRINLLRLSIRHSSLSGYKTGLNNYLSEADMVHNVRICQDLVCATITSVAAYMQARQYRRPFATYATMSLMECLYHLWSLPSATLNSDNVQKAVVSAQSCLSSMSSMGIRGAQNPFSLPTEPLPPRYQAPWATEQRSNSTWIDMTMFEPLPVDCRVELEAANGAVTGYHQSILMEPLASLDGSPSHERLVDSWLNPDDEVEFSGVASEGIFAESTSHM